MEGIVATFLQEKTQRGEKFVENAALWELTINNTEKFWERQYKKRATSG